LDRTSFAGARVTVVLLIVLIVLIGCIAMGCGAPQARPRTIEQVKLQKEDLPDWTLKETRVTKANADPKGVLEQLLDAGAVSVVTQVWEKDGRKFSVNYVQMKDIPRGRYAEGVLEGAVVGTNYIGRKENVAIEIVGNVPDTGLAATKLNLSL
jgi:hypothetical protein